MAGDVKRLLILIPSFNEEKNLPGVLLKLEAEKAGLEKLGWVIDVLVIDDGSRDKTEQVARSYNVRVAGLPVNLGYGAALQTGFKYARAGGYDAVFSMDADGQHRPEDLAAMLQVFNQGKYQVILGSRFLTPGEYKTNIFRKTGIKLFSIVLHILCGKKIADVTTGLQLLHKNVFNLLADEYPHDFPDTQVLLLLSLMGFEIKEVQVTVKQRIFGTSMHSSLASLLYPFKSFLAIMVTLLRVAQIRRNISKAGA
ncbi:MAG TPA: glycosyltransferase family 2 protein [bacterium]|nr:glycosyltransferase family 2 protein [bacterium]HPN44924.1 glycosyltransferase family 2 protein [bacterium]